MVSTGGRIGLPVCRRLVVLESRKIDCGCLGACNTVSSWVSSATIRDKVLDSTSSAGNASGCAYDIRQVKLEEGFGLLESRIIRTDDELRSPWVLNILGRQNTSPKKYHLEREVNYTVFIV